MATGDPGLASMAAFYRQLGIGPDLSGGSPQPSLNDQAAQQIMAASQQAQHMQQGLYDQGGDLEAQRRALLAQQAQQSQAAVPHFGMVKPGEVNPSWTEMRPMTGQGVGHDILNFLGNIGRGAVAGLASTPRGQAVEAELYAPQRAALAATTRALGSTEKAEQPTASEFGAVSSEQARPFGALAETGKTAQQAQQFEVTNARLLQQLGQQFQISMTRLATESDIAKRHNATMTQIAQMADSVKRAAIAAGLDENSATNLARQETAKIAGESRFVTAHDILTGLDNWVFGSAPQAPSGNLAPGVPLNQPRPQGSNGGNAAPARPRGVPAGAVWNPSTRTWQLHQ